MCICPCSQGNAGEAGGAGEDGKDGPKVTLTLTLTHLSQSSRVFYVVCFNFCLSRLFNQIYSDL